MAYLVASAETQSAAVDLLERLGLEPRVERGYVRFRVPENLRLDDAEAVRRALEGPKMVITRRVVEIGDLRLE